VRLGHAETPATAPSGAPVHAVLRDLKLRAHLHFPELSLSLTTRDTSTLTLIRDLGLGGTFVHDLMATIDRPKSD
jgi:hypothetical protein